MREARLWNTGAVAGPKRFVGTDRFRVLSRLGHGGMGTVYEVLDTEQNRRVALKTLRQLDPKALLRFKNEYRALRELNHPNLVRLGELMRHERIWLFTMELVEGTDFLSHAHGSWKTSWRSAAAKPTAVGHKSATAGKGAHLQLVDDSPASPPIDEQRVRGALAQLARGLMTLHDAGQVHRDIKPTNILVTNDDRVVLLDLGLAASVEGDQLQSSEAVGTSEYMSPEQAMGRTAGFGSDWYSVGVMLYEVLTGRVPFEGDHIDISIRKQEVEPLPPMQIAPDCPKVLSDLCERMLRIDPAARPSARDVLRALDAPIDPPRAGHRSQIAHIETPFVGRTDAMSTLRRAFADGCSRGAVVVRVSGPSGIGKSALVGHFAEQARLERDDSVVLSGRCYHGGNVPYKALDHAIDRLATYLGKRPDDEIAAIAPDDPYLIPLLFPVMRRVRPFRTLKPPPEAMSNPHRLRDLGFGAMRQLLANIGATRPLVITIDDIQWSDVDSRVLLEALTAPPHAPSLLLVLSGRENDEHPPNEWLTADVREIELEPLDADDTRALASSLLETADADAQTAATLLEGAGGNPLFIHELARYYIGRSSESVPPGDFDGFIWQRVTDFGDDGVAVLRALAVVGRPLPQKVVAEATGIEYREFVGLVRELGDVNLLVTSGATRDDTIATLHDRVRTAVLSGTSDDERREAHARIATALESTGVAALHPELMVESLAAAGEPRDAAHYAELSANRALDALAFDRAAKFFRRAIELEPDAPNTAERRVSLAEALVQAGRGAAAADHFLDLADEAGPNEAVEYRRRAAEQLLISGRVVRGRAVLFDVLRANRIPIPTTPRHAIRGIMWQRLRARIVGVSAKPVAPARLDPERILRADLCRTAAMGLGLIDTVRGAYFQALHLRSALASREPTRMCRALAMSAGFVAASSIANEPWANKLLSAARALAREIGGESMSGLIELASAMLALTAGRFGEAARTFDDAERRLAQSLLLGDSQDVQWELDLVRFFGLQTRRITGELNVIAARVPHLLRAALDRGHVLAAARMYTMSAIAALGQDRLADAREAIEHGLSLWPDAAIDTQHRWMLTTRVEVELYAGDGEMALERLMSRWAVLERAHLLRVPAVAAQFWWLRGRCALAVFAIQRGRARRQELRAAIELCSERLSKSRLGWALASSDILRAAVARDAGEQNAARDLLLGAQMAFERDGALLLADSVRCARGRAIVGGASGERLVAEAHANLRARGVSNPERMSDSVVPGFAG